MKLTIEINLDNAAFWHEEHTLNTSEILRILQTYAYGLTEATDILHPSTLRDYNGNRVGHATIQKDQ